VTLPGEGTVTAVMYLTSSGGYLVPAMRHEILDLVSRWCARARPDPHLGGSRAGGSWRALVRSCRSL